MGIVLHQLAEITDVRRGGHLPIISACPIAITPTGFVVVASPRPGACTWRPIRLWQHGFHDRALRTEDDLRVVSRYIVANPVRAGLTDRVADHPFWDAIWLDDRNAARKSST